MTDLHDPDPTDPGRYTVIGHRGTALWHPHDPGAIDRLLDAAGLDADATALDIGCGRAEVALRIVERTGAAVRAVDSSPAAIAIARAEAVERDPGRRLTLVCAPLDLEAEAPVDMIVCVGSTHVVGGFDAALARLGGHLRPGGRLLVGEGFWVSTPDPEWLDRRFGGEAGVFRDAPRTREAIEGAGWRVVAEDRVSTEGWRRYERRHNANMRAYAGPDAAALRARSDGWFGDWSRWGSALGFGQWLLERG